MKEPCINVTIFFQVSLGESNGLSHLPAMDRKLTGKKLPGLFEHYRFGRSQDYVVGTPGPVRATPGSIPGLDMSQQQKSSKLKTAINSEKLQKK